MNQPMMTTPEYLQSEEGKAFAKKFLRDMLLPQEQPQDAPVPPDEFAVLLHEFIEHLAQDMREYRDLTPEEEMALKEELSNIYRERFQGFYPGSGKDVFIIDLTRLAAWLAAFTCEAWIIEQGRRPSSYRQQVPGDAVRPMHLHWAREAFGWWLSSLGKLPYIIKIQPMPKRRGLAGQLAGIVADDPQLVTALARLDPHIETDNGCPLC
jgi:hypothetical protein